MTTLSGTMPADIPVSTPGERILLSFVPDDEVPKAHRTFVGVHVRRLAKRHGLGAVTVRYFGPARPHESFSELRELDGEIVTGGDFYSTPREDGVVLAGVTPDGGGNTIALHHGIRGEVVPFVIAHEIRHLLERREGKSPDEAGCDRFASRYIRGRL